MERKTDDTVLQLERGTPSRFTVRLAGAGLVHIPPGGRGGPMGLPLPIPAGALPWMFDHTGDRALSADARTPSRALRPYVREAPLLLWDRSGISKLGGRIVYTIDDLDARPKEGVIRPAIRATVSSTRPSLATDTHRRVRC